MSVLPEAPPPGLTWRPLAADDVDALHRLYSDWIEAFGLPWRKERSEVEHELTEPGIDLAVDTLVGVDEDDRFVASVWVDARTRPGVEHRASLSTTVLPEHDDLDDFCIGWGEARARAKLAELDERLPRVVQTWSPSRMTDRISRLERHGFAVVRYFVEMSRPLAGQPPEAPKPPGVELVGWNERWMHEAWEAHCEAFADHWGSSPPTWEEWQHRFASSQFRPDLSVLAMAGEEVAAYALNSVYPHDWDVRGTRDGWIHTLGTRRSWRRRGLASAVIVESMRRFVDADLDHAALVVDADSPTGAFGLYERLGFAETDRWVTLAKDA